MDYLPPKRAPEPPKEDFFRFIKILASDEIEAWEIYLKLQQKLIAFFERKLLSPSADLADEVLNRTIKKVSEGIVIEDVNRYVFGVAKFLRLEIYKQPLTIALLDERNDGDGNSAGQVAADLRQPEVSDDVRTKCVDVCLEKQSAEKIELLLDYYSLDETGQNYIEQRKKLARKYAAAGVERLTPEQIKKRAGLKSSELEAVELEALYQTISRTRKKVADCAHDCYRGELKSQKNPVAVRKTGISALESGEAKND